MDVINILNDLNEVNVSKYVQYKKLSDLEINKKYKIHDTCLKYSEKYEKHILYLTVELDGEKCSVPVPDKYYLLFRENWERDYNLLKNTFVKTNLNEFTPKDSTTPKIYYNLEFST